MIPKKPKYDIVVAIDPDCEKSGIAWVDIKNRHVFTDNKSFSELVDYFASIKEQSIQVIVEAGYLIKKANWHSHKNTFVSGRIGENTGRNHQTAILLVEMAQHYGLNVQAVMPLKKCWKGTDGKITMEELNSILINGGANSLKRTNQDARDAMLLAWFYAGLPVKCVVNKKLK